jgi:hypothetical protein
MIDTRTGKDITCYPVLEEPKLYIYLILNSDGKLKIGKTKNIQQRFQSLSGSNGGGSKIVKILVSPSTYLYTIETIMHDKFVRFRIPNTEWFYDKGDITGESLFNNAANELKLLFSSTCYKTCNKLRESLCKGGDSNDN